MDAEEFRKRGYEAVDRIVEYYQSLERLERPVQAEVQPGYLRPLLPISAPQDSEPWDEIMSDLREKILPGITHWQHPHFYAWFPANSSFPAILGEMYSAMFNVIGFNWNGSPALTELETVVLDWVAGALGLPLQVFGSPASHPGSRGGGIIQSTASEAVHVALLAAIHRKLSDCPSIRRDHLVAYASKEAHVSAAKAARIAGVRFRAVDVDHLSSVKGGALSKLVEQDTATGLYPFFFCATLGTTGLGGFDDLQSIGAVTQASQMWLHVDAAYAGAGLVCPEYQPYIQGVAQADSFNVNMHKWLLTNFDCSLLYVRNTKMLTATFDNDADFLRREEKSSREEQDVTMDYRNWGVAFGRRFRALKLWFVLRSYGITGLQMHVRKHIKLRDHAIEVIETEIPELLIYPRELHQLNRPTAQLSFTHTSRPEEFSRRLTSNPDYFFSTMSKDGVHLVRMAIGSRLTTRDSVDMALKFIKQIAADAVSGEPLR